MVRHVTPCLTKICGRAISVMQQNKKFGMFFRNLSSHCGHARNKGIVQLMWINCCVGILTQIWAETMDFRFTFF